MITIKKNVYYCEHCKKRGLSAAHMHKHEERCTMNPNRECGLCENKKDLVKIVSDLKARYKIIENGPDDLDLNQYVVEWIGEPVTLDEIKKLANGCPNCTLAILRQTGMNWHCFEYEFDYKKENREYFNENKVHEEEAYY